MDFKVTKCVCFDITFAEMKSLMEKNNITTLEELKEIKTLAENCKLCLPYIKEMIRTGKTEFESLIK
jgi:bacterioferritin-associated ferredoxin